MLMFLLAHHDSAISPDVTIGRLANTDSQCQQALGHPGKEKKRDFFDLLSVSRGEGTAKSCL